MDARRAAIAAFFDDCPPDSSSTRGEILADDPDQFLLLEKSVYDGAYWYSTWATPEDAADYHDGQEYPDDWQVDALVDLDTGERLTASATTTFGRG